MRGCRWAGRALPPCPRRGQKGKRAPYGSLSPSLTPPNPPSSRDAASVARLNGGNEGSVPCVVSLMGRCKTLNLLLRSLPRITVRGQTSVKGVCFALRKAPLRSRMNPWSTRRPCGPLAFRRATGGSRVRRGRCGGVKRGIRNPEGCLAPSCLRRQTAANRCCRAEIEPLAEGKREKDAHPCSR